MTSELLDARGVVIEPGDTVIYGFGVSRSVAMAEAVVLGDHGECDVTVHDGTYDPTTHGCPPPSVSLTRSGRVRLRIIRRSYSDGVNPVVDVAPDRLVVLKGEPGLGVFLPPSPLPTQAEKARLDILRSIDWSEKALANPEKHDLHRYWKGDVEAFTRWHTAEIAKDKRKLKALDD